MAALIVTRNIQEAEAIKTVSRKARKTITQIISPGSPSEDGLVRNAYATVKKSVKGLHISISKKTHEMKSNMSRMTQGEGSSFMMSDSEGGDDKPAVKDRLLEALLNEDLELPETFQTDQLKRWILEKCKHQVDNWRMMPLLDANQLPILLPGHPIQHLLAWGTLNKIVACLSRQGGDQRKDSDVEMADASVSSTCRRSLVRFWLANHWLSSVMSDTSPVSYYSSNTGASFFHGLVSNNTCASFPADGYLKPYCCAAANPSM